MEHMIELKKYFIDPLVKIICSYLIGSLTPTVKELVSDNMRFLQANLKTRTPETCERVLKDLNYFLDNYGHYPARREKVKIILGVRKKSDFLKVYCDLPCGVNQFKGGRVVCLIEKDRPRCFISVTDIWGLNNCGLDYVPCLGNSSAFSGPGERNFPLSRIWLVPVNLCQWKKNMINKEIILEILTTLFDEYDFDNW